MFLSSPRISTKYFYMTKFFRDVHGLEDYIDKSLLEVYDKLPED